MRVVRRIREFVAVVLALMVLMVLIGGGVLFSVMEAQAEGEEEPVRFAVIGDFGLAGQQEADVADLVASWEVDFVATVGDNNYPDGEASTIDENVGQYYHEFIKPYKGSYGAGSADVNRFFPAIGNHDGRSFSCTVDDCSAPHLDYFELPGNERYYDIVWGPVHLFILNSDFNEPDGRHSTSTQAEWLQDALADSTAPWKLVLLHHAPYSSSSGHGPTTVMEWPYKEWGASAVLAGHDHTYERLMIDGLPYFVNGLGGGGYYPLGIPVPGSQLQYNEDYGAMLLEATNEQISFSFVNRAGKVIDTYSLEFNDPKLNVISFQDGIAPNATYSGTRDSHISQDEPTSRFGTASVCEVDGDEPRDSDLDLASLLQWDVSAIPAGTVVEFASITLNVLDESSSQYQLYNLLRPWQEEQVSWKAYRNANNWQVAGANGALDRGSMGLGTFAPSKTGLYKILLNEKGRAVVQSWINDPASNQGLMIARTESTNGVEFSCRESERAIHRPKLTITYRQLNSKVLKQPITTADHTLKSCRRFDYHCREPFLPGPYKP